MTEWDYMQMIIFLYLLDNETSKVVLFSAGIGTLIEFWKVTQAMKVSIDWSRGFPLPKFEDKAGVTCAYVAALPVLLPFLSCCHSCDSAYDECISQTQRKSPSW